MDRLLMSMHLHHPSLSLNGKKKGPQKFASAEHARQSRENKDSWNDMIKSHGVVQEERKRSNVVKTKDLSTSGYSLAIPEGRMTTSHIKSLNSNQGTAVMPEPKVYTGSKVKGIATMHKSNAVPVFTDEEAIDISRMRR
jgi:hypothetical protein